MVFGEIPLKEFCFSDVSSLSNLEKFNHASDFAIKTNFLPLGSGQEIGFYMLVSSFLVIFLFPCPKGWRKIPIKEFHLYGIFSLCLTLKITLML